MRQDVSLLRWLAAEAATKGRENTRIAYTSRPVQKQTAGIGVPAV